MSDNESSNKLKEQLEVLEILAEKMFCCNDLDELQMMARKVKDSSKHFFRANCEFKAISDESMDSYIDFLEKLKTTEQENK